MIRLLGLGLLALSASAHAQSAVRPTRAALQRVAASCGPSLVIVENGSSRGPGVIVGSRGEVLTSIPLGAAKEGSGPTRVRVLDAVLEVEPLHADPSAGLRLLRAADAEQHALEPVPLEPTDELPAGHWVIALVRKDGAWVSLPLRLEQTKTSKESGAARARVRAALPPGTPLFDARGRLVASVVAKGKGRSALVQPLGPLRRAMAGATPPVSAAVPR